MIFPGALGDFACAVPALRDLRARRGSLSLVARGELAALAKRIAADDFTAIDGRVGTWPFLADPPEEAFAFFGRFEEVWSFTGHGRPEVAETLERLTGGRAHVHPFRPEGAVHLAAHYLACLDSPRRLVDLAEPEPAIRASLGGAAEPSRDLVLHPGSGGRAKRWSREGFRRLAHDWRERGGRVVVLLGHAEADERGFWTENTDEIASGLELVDVAQLLARARGYLGNDSGVSHLAGLVGVPGVALFGPTDPALWRPPSRTIRAVRLEPWAGVDAVPAAQLLAAARDAFRTSVPSP